MQTNLNVSCVVSIKLHQDYIHAHILFGSHHLVLTLNGISKVLFMFSSLSLSLHSSGWQMKCTDSMITSKYTKTSYTPPYCNVCLHYIFSNNFLEYLSNTLIIKLYSWPYLFAVQFSFVQKGSSPWNCSIFLYILPCHAHSH